MISRTIRWLLKLAVVIVIMVVWYVIDEQTDLFRTVPWADKPAREITATDTTVRFVRSVTCEDSWIISLPAGYHITDTPSTSLCYGDTVRLHLLIMSREEHRGLEQEGLYGVRDAALLTDAGRRKEWAVECIGDNRDKWLMFDLEFIRLRTSNLDGGAVVQRESAEEVVIEKLYGTHTLQRSVLDRPRDRVWLECTVRAADAICLIEHGGEKLNMAEILAIVDSIRRRPPTAQ